MRDYLFDSKETEEYFIQAMRKYHMSEPGLWSKKKVITKEDVSYYIKDAENILQC